MVNAKCSNKDVRYRKKHGETYRERNRERMRRNRAILKEEKAQLASGNTTGTQFWLDSPQEFQCAEVLASLRQHSMADDTPYESPEKELDKTLRMMTSYEQINGWRYLAALRVEVQRWATIWGGVTSWPESLEHMFSEACQEGSEAALALGKLVWQHADSGRSLLREVEMVDGQLPDEPYALKVLWREYSSLLHLLVRGITIIEARMNALNPGLFRLPGTPWDEEEADVDTSDNEDADTDSSDDEEDDSGSNRK